MLNLQNARISMIQHLSKHHISLRSTRQFTTSSPVLAKQLPPRLKFSDADLTISYLKGSGPGGQKINKTNSAVQIIHKPTGTVVKSQATRSRSQNEKIARQILADKVEQLRNGEQSRVALKVEQARKKKASKVKKSRRKYRDLEKTGVNGFDGEDHGHEQGNDEREGDVENDHADGKGLDGGSIREVDITTTSRPGQVGGHTEGT